MPLKCSVCGGWMVGGKCTKKSCGQGPPQQPVSQSSVPIRTSDRMKAKSEWESKYLEKDAELKKVSTEKLEVEEKFRVASEENVGLLDLVEGMKKAVDEKKELEEKLKRTEEQLASASLKYEEQRVALKKAAEASCVPVQEVQAINVINPADELLLSGELSVKQDALTAKPIMVDASVECKPDNFDASIEEMQEVKKSILDCMDQFEKMHSSISSSDSEKLKNSLWEDVIRFLKTSNTQASITSMDVLKTSILDNVDTFERMHAELKTNDAEELKYELWNDIQERAPEVIWLTDESISTVEGITLSNDNKDVLSVDVINVDPDLTARHRLPNLKKLSFQGYDRVPVSYLRQLAKDYQRFNFSKRLRIDFRGVVGFKDDALEAFADASLQFAVDLGGTSVTEAGIRALAKRCPNIRIKYFDEDGWKLPNELILSVAQWQPVWDLILRAERTSTYPFEGLRDIVELDLSKCALDGDIPEALGSCKELTQLFLNDNNFSGSIPAALGQLVALRELHLNRNKLDGHIPPSLGNLSKLKKLWLSNNNLTGPIPEELGELKALKTLNFHQNNLEGKVPEALGNIKSLNFLRLENNNLSATSEAKEMLQEQLPNCDISV